MTLEQFSTMISDISHVPLEDIKEDSSFRNDLEIDSLQMVNLFIQISERLEIGVDVIHSQDDMQTVGNLYRAVTRGVMNS